MAYNKVLRGQDEKHFVTTIHAIVSGIIKLASIMKLPVDRKVYRGLSGIELPEAFWEEDAYGAKGGVEYGIMSTTRNKKTAVQYSSYGRVPTIFEIEIGQVDRGAELNWISVRMLEYRCFSVVISINLTQMCPQQFPGEEEVVMPPLSNLEVTGDPYLSYLEDTETQVLVFPLRVNVNIKSKTMEDLVATRKNVLMSGISDMQAEADDEVAALAQAIGEVRALAAGQTTEWFNDQNAHRQANSEAAADSQNREVLLKRRRWDLLEM